MMNICGGIGEHYGCVFNASEPFGRLSVDLTGHWKILLTCQLSSAVLICLDNPKSLYLDNFG
jgi:hypothetical protein